MISAKRTQKLIVTIAPLLALSFAVFSQYFYELQPCHLCILQRIIMLFITVLAFSSWFTSKTPTQCIFWILLAPIALGFLVALYQLSLELITTPDVVSACSLGAWEIFHTLSWNKWLVFIFEGHNDCATVGWVIFGLSINIWLMLFYVALMVNQIFLIKRHKHASPW